MSEEDQATAFARNIRIDAKRRRSWLVGITALGLILFNYPLLTIIDAYFGGPASAIALFVNWALVIAGAAWVSSSRSG